MEKINKNHSRIETCSVFHMYILTDYQRMKMRVIFQRNI